MNNHSSQISNAHLASASYIPLVGVFVIVGHRHDRELIFHGLQGTLLSIYFFAAYFWLPVVGIFVALALAGVSVSAFIQTAAGHEFRLPLVADFLDFLARKIVDKKKLNS